MFDWITSVGIPFESNGAKVLGEIARASRRTEQALAKLQAQVDALNASLDKMAASSGAAARAAGDLGAAFRASDAGAARSAAGARAAASSYALVATNATRANAAIARLSGARAVGGGALAVTTAKTYDAFSRGGGAYSVPPSGAGGGGGFGGGLPALGLGAAARSAFHGVSHGAGLAAEAMAGDALYEAGHFQTILTSIQNVTGANRAQMAKIRDLSFNVGDMSGTSASQSADMFREIARQSQGAMSLDAMMKLLPSAAKMQVVLGATRGFTPTQTVDSTMAIVHLLRKYDPKQIPAMMDTVVRMAELTPDNMTRIVTQMTYFAPTLKNLKVKDDDIAALMVAISRFGMGKGKGGTSIQNLAQAALGPLELTQHAQAGKAALLGPRGLNVLDAKGNSRYFTDKGGDIFGFLNALAGFEKKHGSIQAQKTFKGAFGTVGSRIADLIADPVIIDQLHKIEDAIKEQKSLGLSAQATSMFGTMDFQAKRAWNDFQSLLTEIGTLAVPGLTKAFRDLGDTFHGWQKWLHQHKEMEASLSKWVTDTVVSTEKWIASHHNDLIEVRNDFAGLFHVISSLGPALKELGDRAFEGYKAIKQVGADLDAAKAKTDGAGRWLHDHLLDPHNAKTTSDPDWWKTHGLKDVPKSSWTGGWDEHGGTGGARGAGDTHVHGDVHVHVNGTGSPHDTAKAVKAALLDPRSMMRTNASTRRTHPLLPAALTVGLA